MKAVMGPKVVPAAGWRWPACHGCPLTEASDGQDEARDHVASSGEFSTLSFTGPGKSYSQDFSYPSPPSLTIMQIPQHPKHRSRSSNATCRNS